MVVALTALFVALSGAAIAAGALVNGDSLITKGSLSGNRLRGHTLTGKQISLKKLGKVPSAKNADFATNATTATHATHATNATTATNATNAADATTVDGQTIKTFSTTLATGTTTPTAVLTFGAFTLSLTCAAGEPTVTEQTTVSGAFMRGTKVGTSSSTAGEIGTSYAVANTPTTIFTTTDARGTIDVHYIQTDGHHVDVDAAVDDHNTINHFDGCLLEGTAIGS